MTWSGRQTERLAPPALHPDAKNQAIALRCSASNDQLFNLTNGNEHRWAKMYYFERWKSKNVDGTRTEHENRTREEKRSLDSILSLNAEWHWTITVFHLVFCLALVVLLLSLFALVYWPVRFMICSSSKRVPLKRLIYTISLSHSFCWLFLHAIFASAFPHLLQQPPSAAIAAVAAAARCRCVRGVWIALRKRQRLFGWRNHSIVGRYRKRIVSFIASRVIVFIPLARKSDRESSEQSHRQKVVGKGTRIFQLFALRLCVEWEMNGTMEMDEQFLHWPNEERREKVKFANFNWIILPQGKRPRATKIIPWNGWSRSAVGKYECQIETLRSRALTEYCGEREKTEQRKQSSESMRLKWISDQNGDKTELCDFIDSFFVDKSIEIDRCESSRCWCCTIVRWRFHSTSEWFEICRTVSFRLFSLCVICVSIHSTFVNQNCFRFVFFWFVVSTERMTNVIDCLINVDWTYFFATRHSRLSVFLSFAGWCCCCCCFLSIVMISATMRNIGENTSRMTFLRSTFRE